MVHNETKPTLWFWIMGIKFKMRKGKNVEREGELPWIKHRFSLCKEQICQAFLYVLTTHKALYLQRPLRISSYPYIFIPLINWSEICQEKYYLYISVI